jgi:anti-sigma B factor antagonist
MKLAELALSHQHGIVTARITGEIDMSNAHDLAVAITHATPNDAFGLALDLTEVGYLDSAGIHLLYGLHESLQSRGQALRLVIPSGSPVTDALRLAGVGRQMQIAATLDEALRSLQPAEPAGP